MPNQCHRCSKTCKSIGGLTNHINTCKSSPPTKTKTKLKKTLVLKKNNNIVNIHVSMRR
jgi:hypothetical protein